MGEEEPFPGSEDLEPTRIELKAPNVISTFDSPPSAEALRAQQAVIRRHLKDRQDSGQAPEV